MAESCYDDSTPAGANNFLKLVGKYGYCQDDLTIEGRPALDPCNDLYILMCFAAAQVAVGSVQILSCVIGRLKGNGNKVGDAEVDVDGTNTDNASNGGMTVLGVLSWIAGIIMLTIYTSAETFGTSLPNMTPERFYNSFQAAVILNVVLFAFGLLFIVTMTGIFVFSFIFRKGRLGTLFTFIFSVIVMGIAVSFYGCIAFYGWPYVHGDCKEAIQLYEGPQSNNFTVTIDGTLVAASFDDEETADGITKDLESDVAALINQKLMAGPGAKCLVDDDCPVELTVCNKEYVCVDYSTEKFVLEETTKATTSTTKATTTTTTKPVKPECAKGLDCGKGFTCNAENKCVANKDKTCGSKLDCTEEKGKPNCVSGTCVAPVPALNAYGNEYGRIFYDTSCKMITDDARETNEWQFFCEYDYESDAILHNYLNEIEEGDGGASFAADSIECDLLELQFRDFQVETVELKKLEKDGLMLSNCDTETSLITTPEPPKPTGDEPVTTPVATSESPDTSETPPASSEKPTSSTKTTTTTTITTTTTTTTTETTNTTTTTP